MTAQAPLGDIEKYQRPFVHYGELHALLKALLRKVSSFRAPRGCGPARRERQRSRPCIEPSPEGRMEDR
jgi:hypothetical protein